MVMRRLTVSELHAQKVAELGLDPEAVDLTSVEATAAALRRAANFLCPCSAGSLVRGVVRPLRGLVPDLDATKELIEEVLEAMIAHGDIIEQRELPNGPSTQSRVLLYAAPSSFVGRSSGTMILLGISADHVSSLPPELESRIEHAGHVRRLKPRPGDDLHSELLQLGLIELSYEVWLKLPALEVAETHIATVDRILDSAPPSRAIPGLLLLDSARSVRYYRGRWVEPRAQTGRFVARRRQAYGADLWCYVELRNGYPARMVDLPLAGGRWRGCDEAWRLQLAIDARRGEPQFLGVHPGPLGTVILELYSPVPMWARRRWDAVGDPVPRFGCLFAYRLASAEADEEIRFAREALWLEKLGRSPSPA
jgi:hypothetical protein